MKQPLGGLTTLFLLLAVPAWPQITLDRSYFDTRLEQLIDFTNYEAENAAELQAAVDAVGGDQTYDFTATATSFGGTSDATAAEEVVIA